MTLVIAHQIEDRIILCADTMITKPNDRGNNLIPGALKAVIVDMQMTIAFAGHHYISLSAIRSCRDLVKRGCQLNEIFEFLRTATEEHDCEFLVASHLRGAELRKVASGTVSNPQTTLWVGSASGVRAIIERWDMLRDLRINARAFSTRSNGKELSRIDIEEGDFKMAFGFAIASQIEIAEGVGGMSVECLAYPNGHTYSNNGQSVDFSTIRLSRGSVETDQFTNFGGQSSWGFSNVSSNHRGVAVHGMWISHAQVGYIYDPLFDDEPHLVRGCDLSNFAEMVRARAARQGGVPESEIVRASSI